jgi:hypothetical protein
VVEGPILEHQNNDVLDGIVCHNIPSYRNDFCAGKYPMGSAGRATPSPKPPTGAKLGGLAATMGELLRDDGKDTSRAGSSADG